MIIPLYTEDDILRELLDDYKSVERKAFPEKTPYVDNAGKGLYVLYL